MLTLSQDSNTMGEGLKRHHEHRKEEPAPWKQRRQATLTAYTVHTTFERMRYEQQ
jgi:hypothetical protein